MAGILTLINNRIGFSEVNNAWKIGNPKLRRLSHTVYLVDHQI